MSTVNLEDLKEHTLDIKAHVTGKFLEADAYLDEKLRWASASRLVS